MIYDFKVTETIDPLAIVNQIVQNQADNVRLLTSALNISAGAVVDAVFDIGATTVRRAVGVTTAVAANVVPITQAVLNAPQEIGQTVVDTANLFFAELVELDPLGMLGSLQYGWVTFESEVSEQIGKIVTAVAILQDDVVAALSIPLSSAVEGQVEV